MRAIGSKILVRVEMPGERMLPSGIFAPAPNTNFGGKLYESERREEEWWPQQAIVVCSNPSGFVNGLREGRDEVWSPHTMSHVRVMVPDRRPSWRMPAPGDTVWLQGKGLNPMEVGPNGEAWVEASRVTCVESPGGEVWAVGRNCLVEQIPEDVADSPVIVDINPGNRMGIGVVRLVGDGFAELMPGISPGMVVRFKVVAAGGNPLTATPLGDLCPLLPDWVTGVCAEPVDEAMLASLRERAGKLRAEVAAAMSRVHSVKSETEEERKERVTRENQERHWKFSERMRAKGGHERRFF